MKTRPHVTEHEINRFMDFDGLLKRKDEIAGRQRSFNRWRNLSIALCILMMTSLVVVLRQQRGGNEVQSNVKPSPAVSVDSVQAGDANSERITDTVSKDTVSDDTSPHVQPSPQENRKAPAPSPKESVPAQPSGYVQPEPINGYPALYSYFDEQLRYPAIAVNDSIEGVVTVQFVIDVKGKATKVNIENSLGEAFDVEVRRLLLHMPEWRPATYDGNPVDSKISLPITFTLNKKTNP